jgi:hypothetical protein
MERLYRLKSTLPICFEILGFLTLMLEAAVWIVAITFPDRQTPITSLWRPVLITAIWTAPGCGLWMRRKWRQ